MPPHSSACFPVQPPFIRSRKLELFVLEATADSESRRTNLLAREIMMFNDRRNAQQLISPGWVPPAFIEVLLLDRDIAS